MMRVLFFGLNSRRRLAGLVCIGVILTACGSTRAVHERRCQRGDFRGCVVIAQQVALAGDEESLSEAQALYDTACEAGEMRGCFHLGRMRWPDPEQRPGIVHSSMLGVDESTHAGANGSSGAVQILESGNTSSGLSSSSNGVDAEPSPTEGETSSTTTVNSADDMAPAALTSNGGAEEPANADQPSSEADLNPRSERIEGRVQHGGPSSASSSESDRGSEVQRAELLRAIPRYTPQIRDCYAVTSEREGRFSGRVLFQLVVSMEGTVSIARVLESDLSPFGFEGCVVNAMSHWRFEAQSEPVSLRYPLNLSRSEID